MMFHREREYVLSETFYNLFRVLFNQRWCGDENGASIRRGDLKNKYLVEVSLPQGSSYKSNVDIKMEFYGYGKFLS